MAAEIWGLCELAVLGELTRSRRRLTTIDLIERTGQPRSSVYEAISRIEQGGLARRESEFVDRLLSERTPRTYFRSTTAAIDVLSMIRGLIST